MKKLTILISLILLIFLAGCIQRTGSVTNTGVIISKFFPELYEVTGTKTGTKTAVSLLVKNTGGSDAEWVEADLIGLPNWEISPNRKITDIGPLAAADPEHGFVQGEEAFRTWEIKVPEHRVVQTYTFSTRVYYKYDTISDSVIRVVSTDYFRSLTEEQQKTLRKGIMSSATSSGPLTVVVRVPEVLVDPETGGQLPIIFEITNTGGGRAFNEGDSDRRPDSASLDWISISTEGKDVTDCKYAKENKIRLVQGKSGRISCMLNIGSVDTFTDYSSKLKVSYNYFTEASASMKVLKSLIITPSTPPPSSAPPSPSSTSAQCAGYGEIPAANQQCCTGYVQCQYCDNKCYNSCPNVYCKAPNGVSCISNTDCQSNLCSNGKCSAATTTSSGATPGGTTTPASTKVGALIFKDTNNNGAKDATEQYISTSVSLTPPACSGSTTPITKSSSTTSLDSGYNVIFDQTYPAACGPTATYTFVAAIPSGYKVGNFELGTGCPKGSTTCSIQLEISAGDTKTITLPLTQ